MDTGNALRALQTYKKQSSLCSLGSLERGEGLSSQHFASIVCADLERTLDEAMCSREFPIDSDSEDEAETFAIVAPPSSHASATPPPLRVEHRYKESPHTRSGSAAPPRRPEHKSKESKRARSSRPRSQGGKSSAAGRRPRKEDDADPFAGSSSAWARGVSAPAEAGREAPPPKAKAPGIDDDDVNGVGDFWERGVSAPAETSAAAGSARGRGGEAEGGRVVALLGHRLLGAFVTARNRCRSFYAQRGRSSRVRPASGDEAPAEAPAEVLIGVVPDTAQPARSA